MIEDLFYVQLKTADKQLSEIKEKIEGDNLPSEQQLQALLKAYHALDGVKVMVIPFNQDGANCYTLAMWDEETAAVEEPIREFFYQMEQDELFGQYINERDEFLRDWESEDYSAAGAIVFTEQEIDIIEVIER